MKPNKIVAVFVLCLATTVVARAADQPSGAPILQTAHIIGDRYSGFTRSCLIAYADGRYHRERRRQISVDGYPQDKWEAPEAFEGRLAADEVDRLRSITEAPGLRSIGGTVGSVRSLTSMLGFYPVGVVPRADFDLLTISIAHPNGPQVFEIADPALSQQQAPLRALVNWLRESELNTAGRLPEPGATNCSSFIGSGREAVPAGSIILTGMRLPKAAFSPKPKLPRGAPKPQPVVITIVVNADGSVSQVSPKGRLSPDIAQIVVDTIRTWKFYPARLLGVPVADSIDIELAF